MSGECPAQPLNAGPLPPHARHLYITRIRSITRREASPTRLTRSIASDRSPHSAKASRSHKCGPVFTGRFRPSDGLIHRGCMDVVGGTTVNDLWSGTVMRCPPIPTATSGAYFTMDNNQYT